MTANAFGLVGISFIVEDGGASTNRSSRRSVRSSRIDCWRIAGSFESAFMMICSRSGSIAQILDGGRTGVNWCFSRR
jgi:hypothetical protein